eukprot:gene11950-15995_t
MLSEEFYLKIASTDDALIISEIESSSFPSDEAASLQSIQYRLSNASQFFYGIYSSVIQNTLIGFINGTCTNESSIHHDSMTEHVVSGRTLVIHSVTVQHNHRRKGLGTIALKEYIKRIANENLVDHILLLSKAHMISFYCNCGFTFTKLSSVAHGQESWFEMSLDVKSYLSIDQLQVDAFTAVPFKGNPAAVVFKQGSENWMQDLATENNLSETAFLSQIIPTATDNFPQDYIIYNLRWFTPNQEVELCGHATLASTHALYETNRIPKYQRVHFQTKKRGILSAIGKIDGTIELDFPATPPQTITLSTNDIESILKGLHIQESNILFIGKTPDDVFIELDLNSFVTLGEINYSSLSNIVCRGLIVTTSSCELNGKEYDFLSRFFAPRCGINEDPVTGSAHCALAPYWFAKLSHLNKPVMIGYQASPRGGEVKVTLSNDRVLLSGHCVTTIKSKVIHS